MKAPRDERRAAVVGHAGLREDQSFEPVDAVELEKMDRGTARGRFPPVLTSHVPAEVRTSRQALSCSGATTKEGRGVPSAPHVGHVEGGAGLAGEKADEGDKQLGEEPVRVVEPHRPGGGEEGKGDRERAGHGDEAGHRHDDQVGQEGDGRDLVEVDGGDRLADQCGGDGRAEKLGGAAPEGVFVPLRAAEQAVGQEGITGEGFLEEAHDGRSEQDQPEDDSERKLRAEIEQDARVPDEHGEKGERPAAERAERTPEPPGGEDGQDHRGRPDGAGGEPVRRQ